MNHKDPITIERDTLLDMINVIQIMAELLHGSPATPEQTDRLKYANKVLQNCTQSLKENQQ